VIAGDNDDVVPWGTDPVGPDDTALQSESNQLPAGERRNPFLRATPLVPAKTPAPAVAARMSRPALLTGFAVLTVAVVLVVVNGLRSTTATAPAVWAAAAPSSSPTSTSAAPVVVAPVVSISRMTATVTITSTTTATTTQPPLGKTIPRSASVVVPTAGQRTTPPGGLARRPDCRCRPGVPPYRVGWR